MFAPVAQMRHFNKIHITEVWVWYLRSWKSKERNNMTLTARLSWPCKLGVSFDCRGKETGGETVCLNNLGHVWPEVFIFYCIHTTVVQGGPAITTYSDDSRWARRRRVRVRGGWKVPEEPLAFTLPSLVQVVLLIALFACSLVVIVFFQVPHGWPAVFLKVFLVLCIRKKKEIGKSHGECYTWKNTN